MPDLKITLTTSQASRYLAVLKKREPSPGVDEEGKDLPGRTNAQLVTANLMSHISGLVRYDAEQTAKAGITPFE